MAKSVGLDAGEFEVKLVELEGSYRRTRLSKILLERVEQDEAGADDALHASRGAVAALRAFKEVNASRENVTLGFPSREAVFRRLTVPFSGREQIRKVIKFEVEGSIHSHSVDDMVVDFHTVSEEDGETQVMVAAVPKSGLGVTIHALERSGIEPEFVDLDAMALYRVAHWFGAFSETPVVDQPEVDVENGEEEEAAIVPLVPDSEHIHDPARVVLDIGARSTKVLLVVNGQLVDLRTLRSGESSLVEDLSHSGGVSTSAARQALGYPVTGDEEDEFVIPDDDEELDPEAPRLEQEGPSVQLPQTVEVSEDLVGGARARFLDRLRRELIRFLASVKHNGPVEKVWVTGGGSLLPGLDALLQDVFGCAPERLRVFGRLNHNLDEEEVAALEPRVAVAIGLALGSLGGPAGFNFRQEELAYTRGFDRVKFPLAITCMVALFLVVVFAVKSWRDLQWLELKYGQTYTGEAENSRGPSLPMFQGYLAYLLNRSSSWFAQLKNYETNEYRTLLAAVDAEPVFDRLNVIQSQLTRYRVQQQRESGIYNDLSLESGFAVVVRWAEVLERVEDRLGRYLVTALDMRLPANANGRSLSFTVALRDDRGTDFRTKHSDLVRAFEEECGRDNSPFLEVADEGRENLFSDTGGGSYYTLRLTLRPDIEPFVPEGGK